MVKGKMAPRLWAEGGCSNGPAHPRQSGKIRDSHLLNSKVVLTSNELEFMKMKLATLIAVISACCVPLEAQLFTPESVSGAAFGGLIGGIIGHNSGHRTAEGAGIGAGAGLLLGALAHNTREEQGYYAPSVPYPGSAYGYYDNYYYSYRPNYALSGVALGGLAGGIIGHNSHGRTLEGIGIGAGAGLLLGGLAEEHARRYERIPYAPVRTVYYASPSYAVAPTYSAPAVATAPAAPAVPAPVSASQPTTLINNYYGSSSAMSGANSLFGR